MLESTAGMARKTSAHKAPACTVTDATAAPETRPALCRLQHAVRYITAGDVAHLPFVHRPMDGQRTRTGKPLRRPGRGRTLAHLWARRAGGVG